MTPEEKQAIIDKAWELGFRKIDWMSINGFVFYSYQINENEVLLIFSTPIQINIRIFRKGEKEKILGLLTSEEYFENLFNAITK